MEKPLRSLLRDITARKPLTYSRWDTDAWRVLLDQREQSNVDQRHFRDVKRRLVAVLHSNPPYRLSIPQTTSAHFNGEITGYIHRHGLGRLDWCEDCFRIQDIGDVQALLGTIATVPLVVVGSSRLRALRPLLRYHAFVDVPPRCAYLNQEGVYRDTMAALEELKKSALVLISAGLTGCMLTAELHARFGDKHMFLDVGDVWEPFLEGINDIST